MHQWNFLTQQIQIFLNRSVEGIDWPAGTVRSLTQGPAWAGGAHAAGTLPQFRSCRPPSPCTEHRSSAGRADGTEMLLRRRRSYRGRAPAGSKATRDGSLHTHTHPTPSRREQEAQGGGGQWWGSPTRAFLSGRTGLSEDSEVSGPEATWSLDHQPLCTVRLPPLCPLRLP